MMYNGVSGFRGLAMLLITGGLGERIVGQNGDYSKEPARNGLADYAGCFCTRSRAAGRRSSQFALWDFTRNFYVSAAQHSFGSASYLKYGTFLTRNRVIFSSLSGDI